MDSWESTATNTVYSVTFDAGDESNPIEYGDSLTSGDKTGFCYSITYSTASTGTIVYLLTDDSEQFSDDETITGGGNTIVIDGTPAETTSPLTQSRTTAMPQDYSHLEGQTVDVVQDGVISDAVITLGVVVPALTGTTNHVGLHYTATLKPSKLDLEQMGLILTKIITKAIVSFYNTLKGKVGTKTGNMETVAFGTDLFTGIKEVPINGGYEREGDIIVEQDEPMPMVCRGVILNVGAHFKT